MPRRSTERPVWRRRPGPPATGKDVRALTRALTSGTAKPPTGGGPVLRRRVWRFRYHLVPFAWLAPLALALTARRFHLAEITAAAAAAIAIAVPVLCRAQPVFPRRWLRTAALAAAAAMWALPWLPRQPWGWIVLAVWSAGAARWAAHYTWRPAPTPDSPAAGAADVFAELAEARKWHATLGPGTPIPGGMQYPITCRGTKTHIGAITSQPQAVAAAYDKPVTEAYAENDPAGIQSRGRLTLLTKSTLDEPRLWDGTGIDPATGIAVVGRFPDGAPVRERYFILPEDGVKHTIVAGADGSGKTGFLNMGLCISATSGLFAPVILDPQMGQALPGWREHVPYACGPDQCMAFLLGLTDAMNARSAYLGGLEWCKACWRRLGTDHLVTDIAVCRCHRADRKRRKGMGFFNPNLCGLPGVELTVDEAPVLLALKDAPGLVLDIGKLGRKAGFRLRLAVQIPSVAELSKGGQGGGELRSIMAGGTVICFRTGDKLSGGMLNITAAPWELPKQFANGQPTYGLGYSASLDARTSTPMRSDYVPDPDEVAATARIRGLDDMAAECLAAAIAKADTELAGLATAAATSSARQLTVLGACTRAMSQGELVAACIETHNLTLMQATEAIMALTRQGKLRHRADGRLEAAR